MNKRIAFIVFLLTISVSIGMHWDKFPVDLTGRHTWRQTQTQWNIINFYKYDSNILNPRVAHFNNNRDNLYRYEFPIMQWGVAMLHKAFGESIIITRISIFLIGIFSLIAFYLLVFALFNNHLIASLGVWAFNFSTVFYYWTINPIPDNFALCMSLWYLYFLVRSIQGDKMIHIITAAIFLSLATLAKLPFIVLGAGAICHWWIQLVRNKFRVTKHLVKYPAAYLIAIVPPALWYIWVIPEWTGNPIVRGVFSDAINWEEVWLILDYQANEMLPKFLLNPISLVLLFPAIILALYHKIFKKLVAKCLLASFIFVWLYFFFEFDLIGKAHDYYMMPFIPFFYLAITYTIYIAWTKGLFYKTTTIIILLIMPFQCYQLSVDRGMIVI